jgi:anti-anti-sigma factor
VKKGAIMQYKIEDSGSGLYVRLSGDLNFAANADFKMVVDKIAERRGRPLTIDLAQVGHVDSVGLGLLYIARDEAGSSGRKVQLKSPQSAVMKLLKLTAADEDFDVLP